MTEPLIAIVGPTCTGKTAAAVALARSLGRAELINADSRQVRRGLHVGTCAPTERELQGVRCHLTGVAAPGTPYSVADWLAAARGVLADTAARSARPILVGGTGLYVSALVDGFELGGAPDPAARRRREVQAATAPGREALVAELVRRDPEAAVQVDVRNPRRVTRALEVLDASGSLTAMRRRGAAVPSVLVGLDLPAAVHRGWIERRTAAMFEGPLQDEVRGALGAGVEAAALAACGIGYSEAIAVVAGRMGVADAIATVVARTVRYARAQRTWFRRDRRVQWLGADEGSPSELTARIRGAAGV